jgi:hypothetical protein
MVGESEMKDTEDEVFAGMFMLVFGVVFSYLSLGAIDRYFATGWISFARPMYGLIGGEALLMHAMAVVFGTWLAAQGLVRITLACRQR